MTTTLERPKSSDDRVDKLLKTNRTLTLMAIVLAVLAVGFGSWAVYEATSGDDAPVVATTTPPPTTVATTVAPIASAAVPAELAAVLDDWWAALHRRDGSVVDMYEMGGYHLYRTERFFNDDIAEHLGGDTTVEHEWIGEPVLIIDEGDGRYVVVRGTRNTSTGFTSASAMAFEIQTQADGSLLLSQTVWVYEN